MSLETPRSLANRDERGPRAVGSCWAAAPRERGRTSTVSRREEVASWGAGGERGGLMLSGSELGAGAGGARGPPGSGSRSQGGKPEAPRDWNSRLRREGSAPGSGDPLPQPSWGEARARDERGASRRSTWAEAQKQPCLPSTWSLLVPPLPGRCVPRAATERAPQAGPRPPPPAPHPHPPPGRQLRLAVCLPRFAYTY